MVDQAQAESAQAFSLADLANLDTDSVATLTSRLPPEGIFVVDGIKAALTQTDSNDPAKPPLFRVGFEYNVLDAKLVRTDIDPSNYIGRAMRESYTLWANDLETAIGLLKGRYKLAGFANTGRLGGVEGQEPGWLNNMENQRFQLRIKHFKRRDGSEQAQYDWLPFEQEGDAAAE